MADKRRVQGSSFRLFGFQNPFQVTERSRYIDMQYLADNFSIPFSPSMGTRPQYNMNLTLGDSFFANSPHLLADIGR